MNYKVLLLSALSIMLFTVSLLGQSENYESRLAQMKDVEAKMEAYVQKNISSPIPQAVYDQYKLANTPDVDHDHGHHHGSHDHEASKSASLEVIHANYLKQQFLKENPKMANVFTAAPVRGCRNGGFEDGNFGTYTLAFSHDNITGGGYFGGNCAFDPTSINYLPDMSNPDNFQIVTPGADPFVPVQRVQSGNFAARINSFEPITPIPPHNACWSNRGINRMTKTVILTQTTERIEFGYAFILENPNNHNNSQPIFMARAVNALGVELDQVCKPASIMNDPFVFKQGPFSNGGCTSGANDSLTYQNWQCGVLNIGGNVGDAITLEFYVSDCGAGAHFGYAYVDNICGPCREDPCNNTGSIQLNPTDSCFNGISIDVCGSYVLPVINCRPGIYQDLELVLIQNGNEIPITIPASQIQVNTANRTFCITVLAADFPSLANGGYDFKVNMTFSVGGGLHIETDEQTIIGPDNDVVFDCEPICCDGKPVKNGDFDYGNQGFLSGYDFQPSAPGELVLPGEYAILNSAQALLVSPTWNVNCTADGNHLLVNGLTGQSGSTAIWSRTFQVKGPGDYSFCADFKNLPQCGFDVKPIVSVNFNGAVTATNITNQVIDVTGNAQCNWQTLSRNIQVTGTSFSVTIVLDETGRGDGNDLAIDNIRLIRKDQVPAADVIINVSPFNVNNSTFNVSAVPVNPLPADCTYEWKVAELDGSYNEIPGTVVDNPPSWQTHPLPNTFDGYVGTSVLSGTAFGIFQLKKRYRITYTRDCECMEKRSSSWIYDPGRSASPQFFRENSSGANKRSDFESGQLTPQSIRLYPNPTRESLNVEMDGFPKGVGVIKVYNINGELVNSINTSKGKSVYTIDTSNFPAGIYFLRVPTEDGDQNHRFVKE